MLNFLIKLMDAPKRKIKLLKKKKKINSQYFYSTFYVPRIVLSRPHGGSQPHKYLWKSILGGRNHHYVPPGMSVLYWPSSLVSRPEQPRRKQKARLGQRSDKDLPWFRAWKAILRALKNHVLYGVKQTFQDSSQLFTVCVPYII